MDGVMNQRVTISIGEKPFITSRATLAPSIFFTDLFTASPPEQTDFFVDADPELFGHVLRYLRTRMFPLFHDSRRGHDVCLYLALLQQARFYGVASLENWIVAKRYLDAVSTSCRVVLFTLCGEKSIQSAQQQMCARGETLQVVSAAESHQKCWVCPKRKWHHYGSKPSCEKAGCVRVGTKDYLGLFEEMRVVRISAVVSSIVIAEDVCLPPSEPESSAPPPYKPALGPS